jgi:hypothetical protein
MSTLSVRSAHDVQIDDLELSVRSANALFNHTSIRTIGQLISMTPSELLRVKNFGRKSLGEIREILWTYQLSLKDDGWLPGMNRLDPHLSKRLLPASPIKIRTEAASLTLHLMLRWDESQASVLADWCEEHALDGVAYQLRLGPSGACRASIAALGCCFGLEMIPESVHWALDWLSGSEKAVCSDAPLMFSAGRCKRLAYKRHNTEEAWCDEHLPEEPRRSR